MKLLSLFLLAALGGALLSDLVAPAAQAQDSVEATIVDPTGGTGDSLLPQPFDPSQLNALIENPPFNRTINPSDSLVLSGLAFIDGKPVATLFDSESKKSILVTDEPNARGWPVNEAVGAGDISRAQAKVSIGGEVVSIRYNKDALTPDKLKKQRSSSDGRGPPPGAPPSGDGYQRSGPRPSAEDMQRFQSLSDKAREKLRDEFTKNRERLMNATPEERAAFMRSTFERISREDGGGGSSSGGGGSSSGGGGDRGGGGGFGGPRGGPGGPGGPRGDGRGPGR